MKIKFDEFTKRLSGIIKDIKVFDNRVRIVENQLGVGTDPAIAASGYSNTMSSYASYLVGVTAVNTVSENFTARALLQAQSLTTWEVDPDWTSELTVDVYDIAKMPKVGSRVAAVFLGTDSDDEGKFGFFGDPRTDLTIRNGVNEFEHIDTIYFDCCPYVVSSVPGTAIISVINSRGLTADISLLDRPEFCVQEDGEMTFGNNTLQFIGGVLHTVTEDTVAVKWGCPGWTPEPYSYGDCPICEEGGSLGCQDYIPIRIAGIVDSMCGGCSVLNATYYVPINTNPSFPNCPSSYSDQPQCETWTGVLEVEETVCLDTDGAEPGDYRVARVYISVYLCRNCPVLGSPASRTGTIEVNVYVSQFDAGNPEIACFSQAAIWMEINDSVDEPFDCNDLVGTITKQISYLDGHKCCILDYITVNDQS